MATTTSTNYVYPPMVATACSASWGGVAGLANVVPGTTYTLLDKECVLCGVEFNVEEIKILKRIIDGIRGFGSNKPAESDVDQAIEDAVEMLRGA